MQTRGAGWWLVLLLLAFAAAGAARLTAPREPEREIAASARAFLESLPEALRSRCALPFDHPSRTDWHYVPRDHTGVLFADMSEPQRDAARSLMKSSLSARGVAKATSIMSLDDVLREIERGGGPARDPLAYAIAVYGTPGDSAPWAWRIEGHHVSLNFTFPAEADAAVTPAFLGANPAEVRTGPRRGERVLAAEEDLGRHLLTSLTEAQRAEAVLKIDVPGDILSSPRRNLDEIKDEGVGYASLTAAQRDIVDRLLAEYAGNLRAEFADRELARIRAAGIDRVRFAWAGSADRGKPHYYRISGPTFIIEYDNTQNNANHIHTVWHDRERDFGHDALKRHYHDHSHGDRK